MTFTRESIFISAIRYFCNSIAAVLGICIAAFLVMMGMAFFSSSEMLPEKSEITIAADADGRVDILPMTTPAILRINIHGIIGEGDLSSSHIQKMLLDSRQDLLSHNRVKAILLHVNTPGGIAYDSEQIYQALLDYKKKYNVPIYAFIDGMCASGGMYVCSAADKIYASSSSIVGSIGVILGPTFNFSGMMEKIGVQSLTLTQGKDKDMLNPFRPWTPGEDQSLININKALYDQFVSAVVSGRPRLDRSKLITEYGAQVFIASDAEPIGYIDTATASYASTLKDLAAAASLPETQPYQVVQLSIPHSFISQLTQSNSSLLTGKISHVFQIGPNMSSELSGKFLYLYQP